jgi:O-antigen/teichoic acid export membrane protein
MPIETRDGRTGANVFWSGFEAAISAVLSVASAFIVARLVGPAEVGIGASAVAVHVLLWVAVNALFADALVQRSAIDDATCSSALVASVAVGCAAAMLQAALGRPLAWALGDSRLTSMSMVLALPLPLVGAAGPVQGLLTRDRDYRTLAWRTVAGQGLGTLAGIASALAGAGAWALVAQQLVISGGGATALLLRCPVRPRLTVNRQKLRELLRIGLPLTASVLVQQGRYRLFALLIGGTAGAAALGQVHMAFRLVDGVRELVFTAQWRLMLPFLSERQDDLPALRAGVDRCLAWSSLAAFPLCAAMAVAIQPLVATLLGPAWQPSGAAALPLIALMAWLFLAFPAGVAVVAQGKPHYTLIANLAGTTATVLGVLLIRPATPFQAVLVWLCAQAFVSPYLLLAGARVLHTTPLRPLRAGVPLLAASLLATMAAFVVPHAVGGPASPTWLLIVRLSVVAAVGVPLALLTVAPLRVLVSLRAERSNLDPVAQVRRGCRVASRLAMTGKPKP